MSAVKAIALATTLLLPLVASAHGAGGHHAMGIVKAVDEKGLTLHTAGGKDETFALDDTTRFEKSGVQSSAKELKVGDKAVVHARKKKGVDGLVAEQVKSGTSKPLAPTHAGGHGGH